MSSPRITARPSITAIAAIAAFVATSLTASAQPVLYGATSPNAAGGHLLILNQNNGSVITDVGPLVDSGGNPYGVTGLAYNAATNTLYGSTSSTSPTNPRSLVTINPSNGQVTLIGPYNMNMGGTLSDITFQPGTGTLFGWSPIAAALHTVNLATGAATQIGASAGNVQGGGALAFNLSGTLYSTPDAAFTNTLRTVDPVTGNQTVVATLSGIDPSFFSNAMEFNGTTLYASFGPGQSNPAHLGIIDPVTGVVTDLGVSALQLDAIAFVTPVPEPASLILTGTAVAGAIGFIRRRRRILPSACA